MPVIVEWIAGIRDRVDTVNVVDVAVTIIIHAVARDFVGVGPDIWREVWVCVEDSRVHNQRENRIVARCYVPR